MGGQVNFHGGKIIKKTQKSVFGSQALTFQQHQMNVVRGGLYNQQERTCITTLSADLASDSAVTTISINAIGDDIIKEGDKLLIVSRVNNNYAEVTATASVGAAAVAISITSKVLPPFPSGAFIFFNKRTENIMLSRALYYTETTVSNAEYQALGTTEITLVPASDGLILPVAIYIQAIDGSNRELTNSDLYFMYENGLVASKYLAYFSRFNSGGREDGFWVAQLTGHTNNQIMNSIPTAESFVMKATVDFTSTSFSLVVTTQYQMIHP